MLGIQTLTKQHEREIKCMHKEIKNSLLSFSTSSNRNIIGELGIMNMEDYKVVENKLSVEVLVGKEWLNLINLLFTDAVYRALTFL